MHTRPARVGPFTFFHTNQFAHLSLLNTDVKHYQRAGAIIIVANSIWR